MMFGIVSEYFTNLRLVKRCKTCVSGLNTLFQVTKSCEVSILLHWTQLMFVSLSDHFANLQQVKDAKLVFGDWMHCFRVLKFWSFHSTPLDTIDVCECFGSFLWPSTGKRWKTCVWGLNALFQGTEVVKHPFYSIGHNWCFWVFQIISLTFNR
jgi:hypothetical protein